MRWQRHLIDHQFSPWLAWGTATSRTILNDHSLHDEHTSPNAIVLNSFERAGQATLSENATPADGLRTGKIVSVVREKQVGQSACAISAASTSGDPVGDNCRVFHARPETADGNISQFLSHTQQDLPDVEIGLHVAVCLRHIVDVDHPVDHRPQGARVEERKHLSAEPLHRCDLLLDGSVPKCGADPMHPLRQNQSG